MNLEGCVEAAIGQLTPEARLRFAQDPKGVMHTVIGLDVVPVDHLANRRNDGGACDGLSFLADGVVLYSPTPHSRRENFTLAHELGHWLVDQTPGSYDWLADCDEPGILLETVCDRIAQKLLLADESVISAIGDGPILARHLLDVYASTHASRPACAIGLAQYLPGLGGIALIDRHAGKVLHASIKPDLEHGWPKVYPWPGHHLPAGSFLLELPDGQSISRRLSWRMPWGNQADYFINATAEGDRIIAVFSATDIWDIEAFQVPVERDFDARPVLRGFCCGKDFEVRNFPCQACGKPYCPSCGDCPCERVAQNDITCTECFLQRRPNLIVDGVCLDCRS